jgi:hypothetical protein
MAALANPTRRKDSDGQCAQTIESITWPEEARVLSLMAHGFTYDEAWHMGWREWRRYAALAAAWSIPQDRRTGMVVRGTASNDSSLL